LKNISDTHDFDHEPVQVTCSGIIMVRQQRAGDFMVPAARFVSKASRLCSQTTTSAAFWCVVAPRGEPIFPTHLRSSFSGESAACASPRACSREPEPRFFRGLTRSKTGGADLEVGGGRGTVFQRSLGEFLTLSHKCASGSRDRWPFANYLGHFGQRMGVKIAHLQRRRHRNTRPVAFDMIAPHRRIGRLSR
jgi:hypothetical protein